MEFRLLVIVMFLFGCFNQLSAQDSTSVYSRITSFPDKFFGSIDRKSSRLQEKLNRQTGHYLQQLAKQEQKLKRQLAKKDSAAAARLFNGSDSQYRALRKHLQPGAAAPLQGVITGSQHQYNCHLDSMVTALNLLQQNKAGAQPAELQAKLQGSLGQLAGMQSTLDQTAAIQQFLKQRQQYLHEQLGKYGMGSALQKYKETVYYYRAQVDEYKKEWEDPSALEAKAMDLLSHTKIYTQFFNQHSELAGLFRLPGADNTTPVASFAGLQPRNMLQQRLGNGPNAQQVLQRGVDAVQSQSGLLKDKMNSLLNKGGGDVNMPDFKPNTQKTKPFLKRLEYGANIQTQKSGNFFPTTSSLALTAGYKLNDKCTVGIGASYQLGWGKDIQHIAVSSQGIGFRSFADLKLKGSLWISGGGELNYKSAFRDFKVLDDFSPWQKSALLGLSKKYKAGKKLNGNMQLLYDFLWKQHVPVTQPVVFRVGYSF